MPKRDYLNLVLNEGVTLASLGLNFAIVLFFLVPAVHDLWYYPRPLGCPARKNLSRRATFRNLPYRRSTAALHDATTVDHKKTIFIALAGNVFIAVAKLVAGLVTGSAAMLAESAHSFADCINEVLLGVALGRSRKPPDPSHPFG